MQIHRLNEPITISRHKIMGLGIFLTFSLAGLLVLYLMFPMETYFPLYPAIGTTFSPDYSENGFNQIRMGMNRAEVQALIGDPLKIAPMINHGEQWYYSQDGGNFGDFAWLFRAINFNQHGTVTGIERAVFYD
jgi:outer membrane protein assembly factor BamE (lipoprotein component of BamABCDE complex)